MSLRQRAHDALIIDNDIECVATLNELRRECREKGIDPERVNQIIRSENHAIRNKNMQSAPKATPQEPVTPEPPQVIPDKRTEAQLSRRVERGVETVSDGMTPSGTRKTGASGGKSIVDGIL